MTTAATAIAMRRTWARDGISVLVPEKLSLRVRPGLTGMRVAGTTRDATITERIALLLVSPLRSGSLHACPIALNRRLTWRIVGVTSRDEAFASSLNQFLDYLLSRFSLLLWRDGRSRRIGR